MTTIQSSVDKHARPQRPGAVEHGSQLFVGGVDPSVVESDLCQLFESFGPILECRLMRYKDGRTRGFGFVTFKDKRDSMLVLCQQTISLNGKNIECKLALTKEASKCYEAKSLAKKLYVSNLAEETNEKDLETYFSVFGVVVEAKLIYDKNQSKPRGFGFVTFKDEPPIELILSQKASLPKLKGFQPTCSQALSKTHYEDKLNGSQCLSPDSTQPKTSQGNYHQQHVEWAKCEKSRSTDIDNLSKQLYNQHQQIPDSPSVPSLSLASKEMVRRSKINKRIEYLSEIQRDATYEVAVPHRSAYDKPRFPAFNCSNYVFRQSIRPGTKYTMVIPTSDIILG